MLCIELYYDSCVDDFVDFVFGIDFIMLVYNDDIDVVFVNLCFGVIEFLDFVLLVKIYVNSC